MATATSALNATPKTKKFEARHQFAPKLSAQMTCYCGNEMHVVVPFDGTDKPYDTTCAACGSVYSMGVKGSMLALVDVSVSEESKIMHALRGALSDMGLNGTMLKLVVEEQKKIAGVKKTTQVPQDLNAFVKVLADKVVAAHIEISEDN